MGRKKKDCREEIFLSKAKPHTIYLPEGPGPIGPRKVQTLMHIVKGPVIFRDKKANIMLKMTVKDRLGQTYDYEMPRGYPIFDQIVDQIKESGMPADFWVKGEASNKDAYNRKTKKWNKPFHGINIDKIIFDQKPICRKELMGK